eukprot:354893-Chlamydomonas_euryale.AAC.4
MGSGRATDCAAGPLAAAAALPVMPPAGILAAASSASSASERERARIGCIPRTQDPGEAEWWCGVWSAMAFGCVPRWRARFDGPSVQSAGPPPRPRPTSRPPLAHATARRGPDALGCPASSQCAWQGAGNMQRV